MRSSQCLIKELEKMKLNSGEGENVAAFNHKLHELLSKINNDGHIPDEISILVINTFLNASVPTFHQQVNNLYVVLASDSSFKSPDETMSELETLYLHLPRVRFGYPLLIMLSLIKNLLGFNKLIIIR